MNGSRKRSPSLSTDLAPGALSGEGGLLRLARALSAEFGAPVGLLDLPTRRWLTCLGQAEDRFPRLNDVASNRGEGPPRLDRVSLWVADSGEAVTWMWLPLVPEWGEVIAAIGFASTEQAAIDEGGRWGPVCPVPALRAWGETLLQRMRNSSTAPSGAGRESAGSGPSDSVRRLTEGGEGVIIARLIRRFRISDPPERFQQLACNTLRAALGVQAVAWVPVHAAEAIVVSGEAGTIGNHGFRALVPSAPSQPVLVQNVPTSTFDPSVRSVMSVSADTQGNYGWVVAINPLDGRGFTDASADLLQPVASLIATQQTNARVYADLKELLFGVIRALTAAIDAKDPYTSGHSERVARIAVRIAEELGMPSNQRSDLYLMGLLHDVGKIGIDDAVLKKPGPLTPEEYRQIQRHVEIGVQILSDLKKLNHLLPGVRHHHESLDGTGYPCGLAGEAIPWEARILAVADSYDAMSSTRPYRRRLTPGQIDEILQRGSGVQWDPKVIDALFACRMDLEMIRQKGLGESLQAAVSGTLGRS
ncbi:MAG: HD-GYP domain-containing protein [Isosphaeraceae bacterium]